MFIRCTESLSLREIILESLCHKNETLLVWYLSEKSLKLRMEISGPCHMPVEMFVND